MREKWTNRGGAGLAWTGRKEEKHEKEEKERNAVDIEIWKRNEWSRELEKEEGQGKLCFTRKERKNIWKIREGNAVYIEIWERNGLIAEGQGKLYLNGNEKRNKWKRREEEKWCRYRNIKEKWRIKERQG